MDLWCDSISLLNRGHECGRSAQASRCRNQSRESVLIDQHRSCGRLSQSSLAGLRSSGHVGNAIDVPPEVDTRRAWAAGLIWPARTPTNGTGLLA